MDLDTALHTALVDDDIKKHCHVNSNEDGDRFVGIKADSDNAMVYFPIGYQLPETDNEIRTDIKHLIQVLSEFTTSEDRLLAINKFAAPQSVDFPINAYKSVIEYYFSIGGKYYVEVDPTFKTSATGKQDWPRTVRNQVPLVQQKGGVSSFIYTEFTVRATTPNDSKQITQINRFCVYEAFKKLGWLYVPYMPEQPGPHPDVKTSIAILTSKLGATNDDKKRNLFQAMKDMLEYMDEKTSDRQFYFGTDDFDHVWEKLIDHAFGEKDKDKYFPRSRWLLSHGKYKEKRPLMPDTIMIYNGKTRWSYANVWDPKSINGGTPKYSVSLIIPKSDVATVKKIEAAIQAAYEEGESKLKGSSKSVPSLKVLKTPLRDGDLERPDDAAYADSYFINANSASAPGIVDADRQPILERSEVYSGVYGRASINFYAFNSNGNKGIACGLNNLQKIADGEPLGGKSRAEDDFETDDNDDFLS